MSNRVILVGPYLGEFGHEIWSHHSWLRHLKNAFFGDDHFIASSFPGRELLYPFADEFWGHTSSFMKSIDSKQFFTRWGSLVDPATNNFIPPDHPVIKDLVDSISARLLKEHPDKDIEIFHTHVPMPKEQQQKINFVLEHAPIIAPKPISFSRPHVVIFPRRRLNEPWRNWKPEKWEDLTRALIADGYTVICSGASYDTEQLNINDPNYKSIIGASITEQVNHLANATLAITPVCGVIRFLAWTRTKTVTFGKREYIEGLPRVEGQALGDNPFGTPLFIYTGPGNLFIQSKWDYSADEIYKFTKEVLKNESLSNQST